MDRFVYKTRNDYIASLPSGLRMMEVGVCAGDFSDVLLGQNPSELYLLDLFQGIVACGDKDGFNIKEHNMIFEYLRLFKKFEGNPAVKFVRGLSSECMSNMRPGYFDFIYIDADHRNPNFQLDLFNAMILTKPDGIVAGHDYHPEEYPDVYTTVNRAVEAGLLEWVASTSDRLVTFALKKTGYVLHPLA